MASFLFAMSLCRRKAKPFAEMMEKKIFLFIYVRKRGIWQTVIYTLLGADDPQACVRTEEGATRCCNIPTTLHQRKRPPGTNRVFRVWVFISKFNLKDAAESPAALTCDSCINQACECARYKDRGFCSPPINRTLSLPKLFRLCNIQALYSFAWEKRHQFSPAERRLPCPKYYARPFSIRTPETSDVIPTRRAGFLWPCPA